jgi:hypothetical protein
MCYVYNATATNLACGVVKDRPTGTLSERDGNRLQISPDTQLGYRHRNNGL